MVQDRGSASWPVTDISPRETRWKVHLLKRRKTNIRNEVTLPALSDAVGHRSRCQPQAQERAGLPKKPRPGVTPRIRRRRNDKMDDRDTSRKQYDMDTVTTPMDEWNRLPWKPMQRQVFRLQKRIYQASQRGDVKAVHQLQRLLMQSWSARCLAVRKETQDNRRKKTAGVDGIKSLKPPHRLLMPRPLPPPHKPPPPLP